MGLRIRSLIVSQFFDYTTKGLFDYLIYFTLCSMRYAP
jgi:hypothetical protein